MPTGSAQATPDKTNWPPRVLIASTLLGVAATLARDASGAPLVPAFLALILQIPAIAAWLLLRCGLRSSVTANPSCASNLYLTAVVFLAAGAISALTRSFEVAPAILTLYVAAMVAFDAVIAWLARIEAAATNGWQITKTAVAGWVVIILIGTAVLAAPPSRLTTENDYRHNFWRHVSFCAQTSASAACLVGSSGYAIGEDFTSFGQGTIYILMQLGSIGVAALAIIAMRPMSQRPVRLGVVLAASAILQIAGAVLLAFAWNRTDAPDLASRAGWSLFHSAASLFNCGFFMRSDGLATYLSSRLVFVTTTALAIAGSIGLPTFLVAISGIRRGAAPPPESPPAPLQRLVNWEFAAAFWLLVVGAGVLFLCETGEMIPAWLRPDRPVEISANQTPMRDLAAFPRWRSAVFLAVSARSSGFAGVPFVEGGVNWISMFVLCAWMMIGGAAGSYAGGVRTTTLMCLCVLLFFRSGGEMSDATRQRVLRLLTGLVVLMATLTVAMVLLLMIPKIQMATPWEKLIDAIAAANGVGWSTGLAPHLTWAARCLIILAMIAGRLLPLIWWCRIAAALSAAELPAPVAREARRRK